MEGRVDAYQFNPPLITRPSLRPAAAADHLLADLIGGPGRHDVADAAGRRRLLPAVGVGVLLHHLPLHRARERQLVVHLAGAAPASRPVITRRRCPASLVAASAAGGGRGCVRLSGRAGGGGRTLAKTLAAIVSPLSSLVPGQIIRISYGEGRNRRKNCGNLFGVYLSPIS